MKSNFTPAPRVPNFTGVTLVALVAVGTASLSALSLIAQAPSAVASSIKSSTKPAGAKAVKTVKSGAKTSSAKAPTSTVVKPSKPANSSGQLSITISTSEFLKTNVVIIVPAGTKAKKITDSTTTVLTFPDGAQMSVQPDASVFGDFKKNIVSFEDLTKTPAKDRTVFLVDKADRLVYSDNLGANLSKRTVFVMQKKLPGIEINNALATGMLCSDTGLQEETVAPNQASMDTMMAACDSITAGK
jgi:hypothetical protein